MKHLYLFTLIMAFFVSTSSSRTISLSSQSFDALERCNDLQASVEQKHQKCIGKKAVGKKYSLPQLADALGVSTTALSVDEKAPATITFSGDWTSDKGPAYLDSMYFKDRAFSFVSENASLPLQPFEELCITKVSHERSSKDVMDNDGKTTVVSSYPSIGVTIGRKAYGLPIFNSFATVVFDIPSESVVYLTLENWDALPTELPEGLSKFNDEKVKNTVKSRWTNWKTNIEADVDVKEVVAGFIFIEKKLSAAVIQYGKLFNKALNFDETTSWIDML